MYARGTMLMRSHRGFSLIELMLVVAIIAVMATIALPEFQRFQCKSKLAEGQQMIRAINQAIYLWRHQAESEGMWPASINDLDIDLPNSGMKGQLLGSYYTYTTVGFSAPGYTGMFVYATGHSPELSTLGMIHSAPPNPWQDQVQIMAAAPCP